MTVRAPFRWFGGKGALVAKLIPLIPYGVSYVEPFFGAGNVFWNRKRSLIETINDTDGRIINLMRCLQDETRRNKLLERISLTMYSRQEFDEACRIMFDTKDPDPDDLAWAFYVKMNQGFGGLPKSRSWSYSIGHSLKGLSLVVSTWLTRLDHFSIWFERLRGVQIECRNALKVISTYDAKDTVFYLDPPYVPSTRVSVGEYEKDQDVLFHRRLVKRILKVKGAVVLSGYDSPYYAPLEKNGWDRVEFDVPTSVHNTMGVRNRRVEVVWRNPRCMEMLDNRTGFGLL